MCAAVVVLLLYGVYQPNIALGVKRDTHTQKSLSLFHAIGYSTTAGDCCHLGLDVFITFIIPAMVEL